MKQLQLLFGLQIVNLERFGKWQKLVVDTHTKEVESVKVSSMNFKNHKKWNVYQNQLRNKTKICEGNPKKNHKKINLRRNLWTSNFVFRSKTYQSQQLLWRSSADKAWDVNVDECRHQELTVETIHDSTVSGNDVTEVLERQFFDDFEIFWRFFQSFWS